MNLNINFESLGLSTDIYADELEINGTLYGGHVLISPSVNIPLQDNSLATIKLIRAGYETYSVTIPNVYDVDNSITIDFAPILPINDPNYKKPYPGFFSFKNPCSFDVDYYYNSNIDGDIFWFIDNKEVAKGNRFTVEPCNPTTYQVKVEAVVYDLTIEVIPGSSDPGCGCESNNGGSTVTQYAKMWDQYFANITVGNTVSGDIDEQSVYLALDLNVNEDIIEYRPSITLTSDCYDDSSNLCSAPIGEEVVITPTIVFPGAIEQDRYIITWKVTNNGNNVDLPQSEFPIGVVGVDYNLYLDVKKIGDYLVTATITDLECNCTYKAYYTVRGTNFLEIKQSSVCDKFRIYNKSTDRSASFVLSDFDGNVILTDTVEFNSYLEFVIETGLFKAECTYTDNLIEKNQIFIVTNFCEIEDCITDYIEAAICGSACGCNSTLDKQLDAMRQIALSNLFFEKVHKFYYLNNYYTALEDTLVSRVNEARDILSKLLEYCKRKGCNDKNKVNTKSKTKNCGCK